MARGIMVNNVAVPVSDVSYNAQRNPIVEKSFGHATEPEIYGGGVVYTGSFGGAYRPGNNGWQTVIKQFMGGNQAANVETFAPDSVIPIKVSDEFDNTFEFGSCAITSIEINCNVNDYTKITANWIGTFASYSTNNPCSSAEYTAPISVFYNTKIGNMKVKSLRLRLERPFDQQNFIIGSEYLQDLVQNDNVTISGSFTVSPTDYDLFKSIYLTGDPLSKTPSNANKNQIIVDGATIEFRNPEGTSTIGTIVISKFALTDGDASANGRNQFEKTINFKVPVDNKTRKCSFTFGS